MKKRGSATTFDRMMERLGTLGPDKYLDECMKLDPTIMKGIPRRYRLIAMGFYKNFTLEEMNQCLLSRGCEKLYARSLPEAELIYAFSKQIGYAEWKRLQQNVSEIMESVQQAPGLLNGKNLCVATLKDYIILGSDDSGRMRTLHFTHMLEQKVDNLPKDETAFIQFVKDKIIALSEVSEMTRYYFCKYLHAYVECRIQKCLKASAAREQDKEAWEEAVSDITVLRGLTALRRRRMDQDEMKRFLRSAPLSCGGIYDAFNYFYFEYVSADWMQILMEYFGHPSQIPEEKKESLAKAIRNHHPKWTEKDPGRIIQMQYDEMEKEEQMLDELYSLSGSNRGYQRNRQGEKTIRNYITGALDIDRTTLICYLLFFDNNTDYSDLRLPPEPVTPERLDIILKECGFSPLQRQDDFDNFILEYMHAEDPVDYLMECVTSYALDNKNFFLYHMYNGSVSNEEQLEKLL